jgi:hypothetical protein
MLLGSKSAKSSPVFFLVARPCGPGDETSDFADRLLANKAADVVLSHFLRPQSGIEASPEL